MSEGTLLDQDHLARGVALAIDRCLHDPSRISPVVDQRQTRTADPTAAIAEGFGQIVLLEKRTLAAVDSVPRWEMISDDWYYGHRGRLSHDEARAKLGL